MSVFREELPPYFADERFSTSALQEFVTPNRIPHLGPFSERGAEYALQFLRSYAEKSEQALQAYLFPSVHMRNTRSEVELLLNTGELTDRVCIGALQKGNLGAELMIDTSTIHWDEGVFDIEVIWFEDSKIPARILEIGYYVTPQGDLAIPRVQYHRLGKIFRAHSSTEEKQQSDQYLRNIRRDTGISPQAFGLLLTSLTLGQHIPSGHIIVPANIDQTPQYHIQIDRIYRTMFGEHYVPGNPIEYCVDSLEPKTRATVLKIEEEMRGIERFLDFPAMLSMLGTREDFPEVTHGFAQYRRIPVSWFENVLHYCFTNDLEHPDRYKYRGILYGFQQLQAYGSSAKRRILSKLYQDNHIFDSKKLRW